jgi:AcrR family transcriptional regulator
MDSQKSTPATGEAKAPRRARGHARVASLLEAASAEFAEKGYEATTMTAIAARAKSSIGSLYQFFPTKEQVAGTLIDQYVTELEAVLERLSREVPSLELATVAGRLATLFVTFRKTHPAFVVLADVHGLVLPGASGVRMRVRQGVARVLAALAPGLAPKEALFRAVIVQHFMKAAVTLSHDDTVDNRQAAMLEFQRVVQHYLEDVIEAGRVEKSSSAVAKTVKATKAAKTTTSQAKSRSGVSA